MASDSALKRQPNALPAWWAYIFCLMQLVPQIAVRRTLKTF